MLSGEPGDQHEGTILYSDGASFWVLNFKEGRKVSSGHAPTNVSPPSEIPTFVAGLAEQAPEGCHPLSVLGLTSEYALACGLAICGLVKVPLDSSPLLPDVRKRSEERVCRSLWKRTVLALGSGILFMLAFLGAASWFLQSRIELVDEEIESAGPVYSELRALESSVAALQSRLAGGGATMRRTSSAKTLHESARVVPEGLWFTNVEIITKGPGEAELQIHGFARSHQEVSLFLRSLERSPLTRRVRLVRSGASEADMASPAVSGIRRPVAFHIAVTISS
jgi:Tfp pilus assembly protein PilN